MDNGISDGCTPVGELIQRDRLQQACDFPYHRDSRRFISIDNFRIIESPQPEFTEETKPHHNWKAYQTDRFCNKYLKKGRKR